MKSKKDPSTPLDRSRGDSRARNADKSKNKQSESKTIKSSRKRSFNLPLQASNNRNKKINQDPGKYRSEASEKSSRANVGEEDKKTEHLKVKLKTQNQLLAQQLQLQQKIRQDLFRESKASSIDKEEEKIKIKSRFRTLVLQRQGIMKIIEGSAIDPSQLRKQQCDYDEIANDIRLNTMHSKVVEIPHSHKPQDNTWHNMKESQSLMVASPVTDKKHSGLRLVAGLSPEKEEKFAVEIDSKKVLKTGGGEQLQPELGQLDCIEEQGMINSIKKVGEAESSQNVNFASSRQVQINLNHMSQGQIQPIDTIQQSQALTVEKIHNSRASQHRKNQRLTQLQLHTNILHQHIVPWTLPQQTQSLEQQLVNLRRTVRELRLEKIKEIACKEFMEGEQQAFSLANRSQKQRKESGQHYSTIINTLSVDSQSHRALTTQKSDNTAISFGRIRKNKSSKRPNLPFQLPVAEKRPLINIAKLSTASKNKVQGKGERSRMISCTRSRQYRTLNLTKIAQENLEDSSLLGMPNSLSKTVDYSLDAVIQKSVEMRSKLMEKFQADDKKFQKFLIREQSKSRSRVRRYQQDMPETPVREYTQFEGTIIKNIPSPFYQSDQFKLSRCPQAQFLPKHLISLIARYQTITIKRIPSIPKINLPTIPPHPKHNTPTQQIMDLILQILPFSDETYNQNELQGCSLKKYNNCFMFELPNNTIFRIVWHHNGKLYIGEWNSDRNEKQGEGIQYMPNKYYYKGLFIAGKKHGKGVLVQNSSIYDGQFVNGLKEGRGKFYDSQDSSYFEGQWNNNKAQGKGYCQYQGNFYEGRFKDGMKSGFGVEEFANGDKYFGEYNNDKFEGYGKYIWADGASYIGSFKDGYRHDYGKWVSGSDSPQIYTGFYTKDKKQGSGRYVWSNGCVYEGHFQNDFKHGIGSIQYPDGQYMEGVWTQGILTDVISKLSEAHQEPPLDEPKSREYQSHTRIRIVEVQKQ